MNAELCGNFDFLRICLPDESGERATVELSTIKNYKNYCPDENCDTDLDKITIGFLWLLEQYFTKYPKKGRDGNNTNPIFFIHIAIWLSYKLNQKLGHKFTKISDFYTNSIDNSSKYRQFTSDAYRYSGLDDFIEKQTDLLNINIKDLSKFYHASKLICSMYGDFSPNINKDSLLNNANEFVKIYQELETNFKNTNDSSCKQILSALLSDYNVLKNKSANITSLPEITTDVPAYISRVTSSSSSIGNRLFTVNNKELKKYFHYIYANINKQIILFVIWISETSSKTKIKRKNKKYKEENESLIYYSKSSDYSMNSNNSDIF
ncbi:hypothetical protein YYC_05095 [Plasmodium yoelii 17X]|uniref:BIR protein n=1 Tax=Plasmodium yoelii 17X TaxID=1323249 RepID=V7PF73_PLAYE|nr:hypothetical protein YYC_05095 [Plasmodium yoelii 17X]